MESNLDRAITSILNIFLFGAAVLALLIMAFRFDKAMDAVNKSSTKHDGVVTVGDEMAGEEKRVIKGSQILSEILSLPDGTVVKINGTNVSELTAITGDDYITYAKKYGTELLERQISFVAEYKREVELDADGNVIGVNYTIN